MKNNLNKKSFINQALRYSKAGFSIIPIKPESKIPCVEWKKYQKEKADKKQIEEWFIKFPEANIAVVTGKISGIVVVDVDKKTMPAELPATLSSKTGADGWHLFYKYPGKETKSLNSFRDKIDIKADGGYIVLPPSIHSSGNTYKWTTSFDLEEMEDLPLWISQELTKDKAENTNWKELLEKDILKGNRNNTATKVTGKLLYHLPVEIWEEIGWLALKKWNEENCKPPEKENILRKTWDSLVKKEFKKRNLKSSQKKSGGKNKTVKMLKLIEQMEGISYFHENKDSAYIRVPENDHFELLSYKSKRMHLWLASKYYEEYQDALNSSSITEVKNILTGKAFREGENIKFYNRVAFIENKIFYDLTNDKWEIVIINQYGWGIIKDAPPLFKRFQHQLPQVQPKSGGDLKDLLKYINTADKKSEILILVYIVSCFIEGFPHPILNVYGLQGSAKSTLFRLIKILVDPSKMETSSFPKNQTELIQQLSHHWLLFFDNLSKLPAWLSDDLCKAVTGTGFSKRELYSDDDDVIYEFRRCLGINGINLVAIKPDLLERSILIELKRISKKRRKTEAELLSEFKKKMPYILGSIFDTIAKALVIKQTISLEENFRMADFNIWGIAIAKALGYSKEAFLEAYQSNIHKQHDEVIYESYEASALIAFMENKPEWEGTASDLLKHLTATARKQGLDIQEEKTFPKQANVLSKNLFQLEVNIREKGIVLRKKVKDKQRIISIINKN